VREAALKLGPLGALEAVVDGVVVEGCIPDCELGGVVIWVKLTLVTVGIELVKVAVPVELFAAV